MPDKNKPKPELKNVKGQSGLYVFENLTRSKDMASKVHQEAVEVTKLTKKALREAGADA